jgi:hypothetical protein
MTIDDMLLNMQQIPEGANAAYHFRIGTHGANDAANTHPWPAGSGRMLMHNGVIHWLATDRRVSDSKRCGETIAKVDVFDRDTKELIGQAIGAGNKLVVMDGERWCVVNDHAGVWHEGCWFSNGSFQKPIVFQTVDEHRWTGPYIAPRNYSVLDDDHSLMATISDAEQIRQVTFPKGDGKVVLTFVCGEQTDMPAQEFIAMYADFEYTPALRMSIDQRVAQFAINLERNNKRR